MFLVQYGYIYMYSVTCDNYYLIYSLKLILTCLLLQDNQSILEVLRTGAKGSMRK